MLRRIGRTLTPVTTLALALNFACGADSGDSDVDDSDAGVDFGTDPFEGLPRGQEQWEALCGLGYGDPVSTAFCAGTSQPSVMSLADLQALLGLDFLPGVDENGQNGNPAWTLLGHSTAITTRSVTPINPRAFIMTPPDPGRIRPGDPQNPDSEFTILAFTRGESLVELVAKDPTAGGALRFFLLDFEHACETSGCSNADLWTGTIESNWAQYTIYDDETIKNTVFDCNICHQPAGPGTAKILRMQERTPDWLHWFYPELEGNRNIIFAFKDAHPQTETYAGIPPNVMYKAGEPNQWPQSQPAKLQGLVHHNGFNNQPNEFNSTDIVAEVRAQGSSPSWDTLYANTVAGTSILVPYWNDMPTDATKLDQAKTAYRAVADGTMARDQLPNISDVFSDAALPSISIRPAVGSDGLGILRHICGRCHNGSLDQTQTRARFNVFDLDSASPAIKAEAVNRLMLPDEAALKMPPSRFHTLSEEERDLAIQVL